MAIEGFQIKDQVLGTGDTNVYTFNLYLLQASDLLIWIQDGAGNIVETHTGDDTTFVSGLTFDDTGEGTVTLVNDLPDTYVMTLLMANDAPDQTTAFSNKNSFTLSILESALDRTIALLQRVAYLAQRSVKMHDLDDIDSFDPTLPYNIGANPGGIVSVKEDGSGFEIVVNTGEISSAQGYATTATTQAANAALSATQAAAAAIAAAASAAAAAAGFFASGTRAAPISITATGGVSSGGQARQMKFIHGSPGAVLVTANPQVAQGGVVVGNEMVIIGCDDTNTVKFTNGNGLALHGDIILGDSDVLSLIWDGTLWLETSRSAST